MPKELLMLLGKKKKTNNSKNNNKTVQSILCGDCSGYEHIYASFCLWDVYTNTEPLLLGDSPGSGRSGEFSIICSMKSQLFVAMDGSRKEMEVNLFFLMEKVLPCRQKISRKNRDY